MNLNLFQNYLLKFIIILNQPSKFLDIAFNGEEFVPENQKVKTYLDDRLRLVYEITRENKNWVYLECFFEGTKEAL